jgi:hypothetical protein
MARARRQEEQDLRILHTTLEDLHVHLEKATAALEASYNRQMEVVAEGHRKDLSDLYQLQKDPKTESEIPAQTNEKEMRELRELLCRQTPGERPMRRPSQPSQCTALKALARPQVRPAGIFKCTGPTEPPDLLSFSPASDKMEIEGVLAESIWAPGETHPERIPQVLVVSSVQSPKRHGRDAEREGKPEAPMGQEPSTARVGSEAELPTRQGVSADREGDRQAPMRLESGAERERNSKGVGAMVDVQTQTQRLGRSRSRGRRFHRSRTPSPQAGPIPKRTSPVPKMYAAVAAQVTGTTPARVPTRVCFRPGAFIMALGLHTEARMALRSVA